MYITMGWWYVASCTLRGRFVYRYGNATYRTAHGGVSDAVSDPFGAGLIHPHARTATAADPFVAPRALPVSTAAARPV